MITEEKCPRCKGPVVHQVKLFGDLAMEVWYCMRGGDGHLWRAKSRPATAQEKLG